MSEKRLVFIAKSKSDGNETVCESLAGAVFAGMFLYGDDGFEMVVRFVEVPNADADPCEWELSPFGEVSGEPNTKTWLNFITDFWYKFCPQCGRSLKEE